MNVGTKSLLWGSHQFVIHPIFVAFAWVRLYGWRDLWRWQLWLCIVVHDWGYWGCVSMDGDDGLRHPERGAKIAYHLAGPLWGAFSAGHSRSYAAEIGIATSRLMRADKLGTALYPLWLYALLCSLSGEWIEYRDRWVAAGTYPGASSDGVRAFSQHFQANWARFLDPNAVAGRAFGAE